MTSPLIQQLDSEKFAIEQAIRQLQTERKQLALSTRMRKEPKKRERIDDIDAQIARHKTELGLIADARAQAEVETAQAADAAEVDALKEHVAGALKLAESRVIAAGRIDRALDELTAALGSYSELGAGTWSRAVQAGHLVDPERLPPGIEQAHGFAFGDISPMLSALNRAIRSDARLRGRVELAGFTDPQPSVKQRAEEELQRLIAVLQVHASVEARAANKAAREGRVPEAEAQDLRAAKIEA